jgi:hypothetical protein
MCLSMAMHQDEQRQVQIYDGIASGRGLGIGV